MKRTIVLLSLAVLLQSALAQVAAKVRVSSDDGGPVYATIDGKEKRVAAFGYKAWVLDDGQAVVYSARGAGGFEGEGQTLYRYDTKSGEKRRILAEPFEITNVQRAVGATGKAAYLVSMEDGGLGATHIAVVDPRRGEVFRQDGARFGEVNGKGTFTVNWYRDEDWGKLRDHAEVKPTKSEQYEVDQVLGRKLVAIKR